MIALLLILASPVALAAGTPNPEVSVISVPDTEPEATATPSPSPSISPDQLRIRCERVVSRQLRSIKAGTFASPQVRTERVKFDSKKVRSELDRLRKAIDDTKPETKERSQAELKWSQYFALQPLGLLDAQARLSDLLRIEFEEAVIFHPKKPGGLGGALATAFYDVDGMRAFEFRQGENTRFLI